jgi:hypothetical protein
MAVVGMNRLGYIGIDVGFNPAGESSHKLVIAVCHHLSERVSLHVFVPDSRRFILELRYFDAMSNLSVRESGLQLLDGGLEVRHHVCGLGVDGVSGTHVEFALEWGDNEERSQEDGIVQVAVARQVRA